ncbi:MAG: hypothetical protein JWL61_5426 [Gemmatimonadetes bacterium]|nr:hypothetical protein [Gemmatimonadota bacterium]
MAMYTAYFDASGNHDNVRNLGAYYVCGFVASSSKWEQLEAAWPRLLADYDMPQPFRMAEFMARDQKHPNAFTGWPGDVARQDVFRLAVAKLTHSLTNKPFAVGVVNADLRRMFDEYEVPSRVPRPPYPWCALRTIEHLMEWALNRERAGKLTRADQVGIVFEKGDYDQDKFVTALWNKYEMEVAFEPNTGKKSCPFAVCDWFAWECRHWMTARERGVIALEKAKSYVHPETSRVARMTTARLLMEDNAIMNEIARRLPNDALKYANWDALQRMCEEQGWPLRKRGD